MSRPLAIFLILASCIVGLHEVNRVPSEPFFNGDETRHVMTGIFVRDALRDGGYFHPRAYAERYYAQYPALGLIVWPPGFYAVEGVAMLAFGPTVGVGRHLTLAYWVLAAAYLFALARRTHGLPTAALAVVLFGVSREVFYHTRFVMLELPLTACVTASLFHLERYLAGVRRRDLVWLAFWAVAAGCHRYEAVYLVPIFGLRLFFARKLSWLRKREVLVAVVLCSLALAPIYILAMKEIGGTQFGNLTAGATAGDKAFGPRNLVYYPWYVWFQIGQLAAVACGVGLMTSLRDRERAGLYWAWMLGVYLTLSPIAELGTRHAIVWIPALCVFAAEALLWPLRRGYRFATVALVILVVGQSAYWTLHVSVPYVRGYRDAAAYVLGNTRGPTAVLFDGLMDGTFVYEVRTADVERRAWVLRGDKLLYAVRSDPFAGYVDWARDEGEVLNVIAANDPAFLVTEDPPGKFDMPGPKLLRSTIARHPELFERVAAFPVRQNRLEWLENRELVVYKYKPHDPSRPRIVRLKMFRQGTEVVVGP